MAIHREALFAGVLIVLTSGAARAQDDGCKPIPTIAPARDNVSDMRCFPQRFTPMPVGGNHDRTSPLSIVLASVGTVGVGTFIGFGIAGQAQLVNGIAPRAALDSIRVDYAIANVALAVGLTALVTSIVLLVTHH